MKILQADEFLGLFEQCKESAFHIEVRDAYAVPDESEPFRRFLRNEEDDYEWFRDWLNIVNALGKRGAIMTRVRVVTEPHSDYHRWLLKTTKLNAEAGEDIRYLSRQMVDASKVPSDDWWIFDNHQVVFNLVDNEGRPAGGAATTDIQIVEHCRRVREQLWEMAIPYPEYFRSSAEGTDRP
ncbi:DUF6879 family protein [Nocardia brasiliensis]|uniref:DUF6879 family protein n=1 Tax=Nocardia brasiliensis TaxID=37326 RepID=UPI002454DD35|nr:DUF6879 family protein [Nocardia brasiliensis]